MEFIAFSQSSLCPIFLDDYFKLSSPLESSTSIPLCHSQAMTQHVTFLRILKQREFQNALANTSTHLYAAVPVNCVCCYKLFVLSNGQLFHLCASF